MNIGLIVIILIVIALIVGPVRMMQPSPAQKQRENLRLAARARGVHFAMRNLPQQADEQSAPGLIPVYFLPPTKNLTEKGWMLLRANYAHDIHFLGAWAWRTDTRPSQAELDLLSARLPSMPESVRALSAGSEGICVFWPEVGGEAALTQIIQLLEDLKAAAEG